MRRLWSLLIVLAFAVTGFFVAGTFLFVAMILVAVVSVVILAAYVWRRLTGRPLMSVKIVRAANYQPHTDSADAPDSSQRGRVIDAVVESQSVTSLTDKDKPDL